VKPILIFRHIECEGPGFLAEFLAERDLPFTIVAIDQNDALPENCDEASALVFMGGPMSVNDPLPWIEQECRLIRQAVDHDIPVLGHCLGGQLISKALGGVIQKNPVREIGWFPVDCVSRDAADGWLQGLPPRFEAFHWHGETFSIPEGAERLFSSEFCANQGFGIGSTLAMQCHIEMTAPMVRQWADLYRDEIAQPSTSVQSHDDMVANVEQRAQELQQAARTLYERWITAIR